LNPKTAKSKKAIRGLKKFITRTVTNITPKRTQKRFTDYNLKYPRFYFSFICLFYCNVSYLRVRNCLLIIMLIISGATQRIFKHLKRVADYYADNQ